MANRGRPKKNKEVPLSEDSKKIVEQGLKEAGEGKLDNLKDPSEIIKELNKKFGFTALNFADKVEDKDRLKFKQKRLNDLTGGGLTYGQFHTIWGGAGSGKSSVVLDMIAEAQKQGKTCLYCDLEHSYNPDWARQRGVDATKLVYGDFSSAEQPLDSIIAMCKASVIDLIVIDSLHGLSPKAEQEEKSGKERSVEDDSMALVARKLSQFFRMASGYVAKSNTAVVMIGQTRKDLGSFVKLETLSGGNALLHWSSSIIHLRRGQGADAPTVKIKTAEGKTKDVKVGFSCVIKVTKSKLTGCYEGREINMPFYMTAGLSDEEIKLDPKMVEELMVEDDNEN